MSTSAPPRTPPRDVTAWSLAELASAVLGRPVTPPTEDERWKGQDAEALRGSWRLDRDEAQRLVAARELGRRALLASTAPPTLIRGGADLHAWLRPRLVHLDREEFHAFHLDARGALLHEECVSRGTLTSSLVHPREVFAPALRLRAAAVVVAHNHPSGDPEPSAEDRAATRRLHRAGRLLGVELLDHVVVARNGWCSFLERGWL